MKKLTLKDVTQHSQPHDCWVIVDGQVYNVTELIKTHSGGSDKIISFCGQDASDQFRVHDHSDFAKKQLETYLIGKITDD